jgi:hypothetical protein
LESYRDDARGVHRNTASGIQLEPRERARAAATCVLDLLRDLLEPARDLDRLTGHQKEPSRGHLETATGGRPQHGSLLGDRPNVYGLRSLVRRLGLVLDLCALGQRLEAIAGDAAVMDEEVLTYLVRRDEAEALVVVEPLHCSGGHVATSTIRVLRSRRCL